MNFAQRQNQQKGVDLGGILSVWPPRHLMRNGLFARRLDARWRVRRSVAVIGARGDRSDDCGNVTRALNLNADL